jgi:transcriptional regulator with XRE-family HTH domain
MEDLKTFRRKYGISQMEMCERIGVSLNGYILWERRINTPTPENQIKIDKALERIRKELE